MKNPIAQLAFCLVAAFIGAGSAYFLSHQDESRPLGQATDAKFAKTLERLDQLESELADLRNDLKNDQLTRRDFDDRSLSRRQDELEAALQNLQGQFRSAGSTAVATAAGDEVTSPELQDLIDERIRATEAERRNKKAAQDKAGIKFWTTAAARDVAGKLAKKVQLSESQTTQFRESLAEAMSLDLARFDVLKSEDGDPEARLQAVTEIRQGWQQLDDEMRTVFSAAQFEEYERDASTERAKIAPWLDGIESGIRSGGSK